MLCEIPPLTEVVKRRMIQNFEFITNTWQQLTILEHYKPHLKLFLSHSLFVFLTFSSFSQVNDFN